MSSPPTLLKLIGTSPTYGSAKSDANLIGALSNEPKTMDQSNLTSLISSFQETINSQRETIDGLTKVNEKIKKENKYIKKIIRDNKIELKIENNDYDDMINSRKRRGSDDYKTVDDGNESPTSKSRRNSAASVEKEFNYDSDTLSLSSYSSQDEIENFKTNNQNYDISPLKQGFLKMKNRKHLDSSSLKNGKHNNSKSREETELYKDVWVILYESVLMYYDKRIKLQPKNRINYNHPKGVLYLRNYNLQIRSKLSNNNVKPIKLFDFTLIPHKKAIKQNLLHKGIKIRFYTSKRDELLHWTNKIKLTVQCFRKIKYPTSKGLKLYGVEDIDKFLKAKKEYEDEITTFRVSEKQISSENKKRLNDMIENHKKEISTFEKILTQKDELIKKTNEQRKLLTKELSSIRKETNTLNNTIKKNQKIINNYVDNEKSLFNHILIMKKWNDKIDNFTLQNVGANLNNKNKMYKKKELYDNVQKGMINLLEQTYQIYNNNMDIPRLDKEMLKNYIDIVRKYIKLEMNYTSLQQNHDDVKEDMKILKRNLFDLQNIKEDQNDLILNTAHFM